MSDCDITLLWGALEMRSSSWKSAYGLKINFWGKSSVAIYSFFKTNVKIITNLTQQP